MSECEHNENNAEYCVICLRAKVAELEAVTKDMTKIHNESDLREIERLTAEHKAAELLWWDEKGALEDQISELQARVELLEGVRDAAEQIMWCDACEAKWSEQYETLANALAALKGVDE